MFLSRATPSLSAMSEWFRYCNKMKLLAFLVYKPRNAIIHVGSLRKHMDKFH